MTRVIQGFTQFYLPPNTSHTCLYSPAVEHRRPLTVLIAPTHGGMARLSWHEWLVRPRVRPGVEPRCGHTHPSTNRAWRRATSLIWPTSTTNYGKLAPVILTSLKGMWEKRTDWSLDKDIVVYDVWLCTVPCPYSLSNSGPPVLCNSIMPQHDPHFITMLRLKS